MESIKQAIIKALEAEFGMSTEEAEERIFDSQEIDKGIGAEMMTALLGGEEIEFLADGLSRDGHEFELYVSWNESQPELYRMLLLFQGKPIVANVEEAFAKYEGNELSQLLQIDHDIESEDDSLGLSFDYEGPDLSTGLAMMFLALRLEPCTQLMNDILGEEDI